jgi:uncharacterized protein (DUF4415 family)
LQRSECGGRVAVASARASAQSARERVLPSPFFESDDMPDQPRRPRTLNDARTEAEAAFRKTTTKVAEAPPKKTALPGVKELVSLRIDQDVLEHFQEAGPGWQDRINDALRKAAGK